MNEQERTKLIEALEALRLDERVISDKLTALPEQHRFGVCLAKLTAFDAAITMEISDLREE